MHHSDIDLLQESITNQQEDIENKHILVSNLTDPDDALDESVQINFDKELISQLEEDIVILQRKNIYLLDQVKDKDHQIQMLKERVQRQTLLTETYQIAEVQLKQQIEDLKKKIEELHQSMTINTQQPSYVIPKVNLDFSWVNHMERDLSHDGLLERYDRYKSTKRLAPISTKPFSEKFRYNNVQNSPYFEPTLSERKQITQRKQLSPQLTIPNCLPDLPYFTIHQPINNHKDLTLYIATHKACKACCWHETIYKKLVSNIRVNFIRVELENNPKFIDNYSIKRFPAIFLKSHSETIHHYEDLLDYDNLIYFINYYTNGFQLQQFLSLEQIESLSYSHNQVYVIGIFYSKNEYQEEIKQFTQLCHSIYHYKIHFGILIQPDEVKKLQTKYQQYTHILISRYPNHYKFIEEPSNIKYFLPLISELKIENSKYFLKEGLIIIDSIADNYQFLSDFQQIAQVFDSQIYFAWIDGSLNEERLQMLGIEKFDQTKLTIFDIQSNLQTVFNGDVHNKSMVIGFYRDYLRLDPKTFHQKYTSIQKEITPQENTLTIYVTNYNDDNKYLIKQVKSISKKFGNSFKVDHRQGNTFKLVYYYDSTEHILSSIEMMAQINPQIKFPKDIPLLIDEHDLIEYLINQYQ